MKRYKGAWHLLLIGGVALLLTACGSSGSNDSQTVQGDGEMLAKVLFSVPSQISGAANVDLAEIRPSVVINGQAVSGFARESEGNWSRDEVTLLSDATNRFAISWIETIDSKSLKLGEVSVRMNVDAGTDPVVVDQSSFSAAFDEDGDGVNNLTERINGTDPFSESSSGGQPVQQTSLKMIVNIPEEPYANDVKVDAVWGPTVLTMTKTGRFTYEGTLSGLTANQNGAIKIKLFAGGQLVADQIDGEKKLLEGYNEVVYRAADFTLKAIDMNVSADLSDLSGKGPLVVTASYSNGVIGNLAANGNNYSKTFSNLDPGSRTIELRVTRQSDNLVWATASKKHEVVYGPNTLAFSKDDLDFNIDSDGDGTININDPDPVRVTYDVRVPLVGSASSESIDGNASGGAWNSAALRDDKGRTLSIDNLMIDVNADRNDGAPFSAWKAMHDSEYLYIAVTTADQVLTSDSRDAWNDDNLNLYWDGNNSKGTTYDSDDYHLLIPMLIEGGKDTDFNNTSSGFSRVRVGSNSAGQPADMDWAMNCTVKGLYECTYEIRMRLADAQIPLNKPFGFDVHIDDDDDGGDRDSKWGWFHPSRGDKDVDFTYRNPSYMATIILLTE